MASTETARLEREAEETRAQLEHTLGELRARMSPGQILDQATDYFRHSGGRAYLSNLRDEVVHNPMPVALVGAGIAWLAISSAIGRRNGHGNGRMKVERDWSESAAVADDLAHSGDPYGDSHAGGMGERVSTAYDETGSRAGETAACAREKAAEWSEEARSASRRAGEALHEGMAGVREGASHLRERVHDVHDRTAGGMRRAAGAAKQYGQAARAAVRPDGALMNFCREQPLVVAGLGVAIGAALGAMIPASRAETRVMGDASRTVQDRVRGAAEETMQAFKGGNGGRDPEGTQGHGNGGSAGAAPAFEPPGGVPGERTAPVVAPYSERAEAGGVDEQVRTDETKPYA